ncbi:MAG: hypothetical protein CFE24_03375 [Flavobacterium sp. BFFFF2]|nr:MAG: hypothetical protein CFE24_03375 [Flavobacterium sp. BFFFF2]
MFWFLHDLLLLIHDFVHFLCWPKENEPKERALLARIKGHFCLRQNQFRLAENPSKASGFYAASETYDYICGPALT